MKKKSLLFTAACGLVYLSLSSNASGPAHSGTNGGDLTGRISATNTCGGCHSGGSGTTTATIEVRRKDWGMTSAPVTGFIAGEDYIVTLKGTNSAIPKFGFQLLAVEGTAAGTASLGTFGNLPASTHQKAGTVNILEHSASIAKTGSDYVINVDWTAPASTSASSVTFCGIINAVNGDNNTGGDKTSAPVNVTLQNTSSVENVSNSINLNAFPNPITGNTLNLDMDNAAQGNYNVAAYNVTGSKIYSKDVQVNSASYNHAINTERWASGIYIISISKDNAQQVISVVKQ